MRYQFVDCRWELGKPGLGRELYEAGHIPGASFLDVEADLSDLSVENAGRHPLPSTEAFAAAAGRAGIGPGVMVVAYGSMGGAERLWWLLRHFGHDDCAVLEGGLDAWRGPLTPGPEAVEPAVFVPRAREDDTIGIDELAERLARARPARCASAPPVPRRAQPRRQGARPHPRRDQHAVGGSAARPCRRARSSRTAARASPPA